ncbi:hypothetical protein J1605_007090 [Eschrichtius robustus]|uniref:Uncharacterized protein n=1 Tax=Eschrichtius robustus TaxID=9764 RepID=A0AB34GZF6_ESCRO|nr:hypothetical protein J1605_007090 [Eschrichtius robustus]
MSGSKRKSSGDVAGADRHRSEPRVHAADGAERAAQHLHERVSQQRRLGGPAPATRDRPRRAYRLQGQGAISNDVSWANINMQPNPGGFVSLQLGAGREPALRRLLPEYLCQGENNCGELYSHRQATSEPMSWTDPPGPHGDYADQLASYAQQSYHRLSEESTQHYHDGGKAGRAACCGA